MTEQERFFCIVNGLIELAMFSTISLGIIVLVTILIGYLGRLVGLWTF